LLPGDAALVSTWRAMHKKGPMNLAQIFTYTKELCKTDDYGTDEIALTKLLHDWVAEDPAHVWHT